MCPQFFVLNLFWFILRNQREGQVLLSTAVKDEINDTWQIFKTLNWIMISLRLNKLGNLLCIIPLCYLLLLTLLNYKLRYVQDEVDEELHELAINAEGTRTLFTTMSIVILSFLLLYVSILYLWHALSTFSIR